MCRPNGCLASIRTSLGAPPPLNSGARSKQSKTRAQKRAAGTKECCLMSAMSKRTRAERELAEQLRPSCAQPMDGCACGEGAAIRTVSASAAAAGMPIDAARASRHRAGNGCGTCYEASSKDSRTRWRSRPPTWHASPIASEESCAGRASRAGTLSNTSSFTTAVGGTSIKCRCRRRSIRSSNGWSPRRGCGTRVPRMSGPTCAAMRRFSRRNVRRCVV